MIPQALRKKWLTKAVKKLWVQSGKPYTDKICTFFRLILYIQEYQDEPRGETLGGQKKKEME